MCKWIGLAFGCLVSAFLLTISLSFLVMYIKAPLDILPKLVPVLLSSHPPEAESPSVWIAVSCLVLAWFSGIFFSTFSRTLAESLRDTINNRSEHEKSKAN